MNATQPPKKDPTLRLEIAMSRERSQPLDVLAIEASVTSMTPSEDDAIMITLDTHDRETDDRRQTTVRLSLRAATEFWMDLRGALRAAKDWL